MENLPTIPQIVFNFLFLYYYHLIHKYWHRTIASRAKKKSFAIFTLGHFNGPRYYCGACLSICLSVKITTQLSTVMYLSAFEVTNNVKTNLSGS
jgi:hypothetical protein